MHLYALQQSEFDARFRQAQNVVSVWALSCERISSRVHHQKSRTSIKKEKRTAAAVAQQKKTVHSKETPQIKSNIEREMIIFLQHNFLQLIFRYSFWCVCAVCRGIFFPFSFSSHRRCCCFFALSVFSHSAAAANAKKNEIMKTTIRIIVYIQFALCVLFNL